ERGAAALAGGTTASTPGGDAVRALVPGVSPGRQQDAYVSDVQPSPNYVADHTLYETATDTACDGRGGCGELFWSQDAGHSWTNLRTVGLQPYAQLLLPPSSYAAGLYYAFGSAGLQLSQDHGRTFTTMIQDLP